MEDKPAAWRAKVEEVAAPSGRHPSYTLPNLHFWRLDIQKLASLTGVRRIDFESDEHYAKVIADITSPTKLPESIPPIPDQFVKSSLVDAVTSALLYSGNAQRCVVMNGIAGVGKSSIASAVARETVIRRRFFDGVMWLNDEPGEFISQRLILQLNVLAKQFLKLVLARHHYPGQIPQQNATNFKNSRDATDFFATRQKKYDLQCLLVVDNARSSVRSNLLYLEYHDK